MTGSNSSLAKARALLKLQPNATRSEIVQAFRRRARTVHPDVSTAADAMTRFVELSAAYRLALAHMDERPSAELRSSTATTVAVRHSRSAPLGTAPGTQLGTSPLLWAGPPIVVSQPAQQSRPVRTESPDQRRSAFPQPQPAQTRSHPTPRG